MVICLERGADLHMAHVMPLPLTVLPFWYRLTHVVPEKGPLNGCMCVDDKTRCFHDCFRLMQCAVRAGRMLSL